MNYARMQILILRLTIAFLILSKTHIAQNLIPNPSFENLTSCPKDISTPGDYQIEKCIPWYSPSEGTSDFFHRCCKMPACARVGVPTSFLGYQHPYDGEAYLGFGRWAIPYLWYEYIQAPLNSPLRANRVYKLSFYLNLANYSVFASKKVGAWVTAEPVKSNNPLPLFRSYLSGREIPPIIPSLSFF